MMDNIKTEKVIPPEVEQMAYLASMAYAGSDPSQPSGPAVQARVDEYNQMFGTHLEIEYTSHDMAIVVDHSTKKLYVLARGMSAE